LSRDLEVSPDDSEGESGFFSGRPRLLVWMLAMLFLVSFCIRVYRLGDPPLGFHPVRQYFGALVARSYYYSYFAPSAPAWMRTVAASQDPRVLLEPPILDAVTLPFYLLAGGAELWIPRLLSSLFWLVGAVPLYLLVKRTASTDAAIVSAAFYLLLPYGVFASRTIMPNPLMVMMMLFGLLLIARYGERPTIQRAAVAGTVTGLAILIEPFPLFMTLGAFAALTIERQGLRRSFLDLRAWIFSIAAVSPAAIYYLYGVCFAGKGTFGLSSHLQPQYLFDPLSYRYWLVHIQTAVGFGALVLALLGVLLFRQRVARSLVTGLWCGYLVYGLVFIYHMRTHDYYQLLLIPLVAMCLGPVGAVVLGRLDQSATHWPARAAVWSVLGLAVVLALGTAGTELARHDFSNQVRIYEEVGEAVHHSTNTIFLTEHYGLALEYHGWLSGKDWPAAADARAYGLHGLSGIGAQERFRAEYASANPEYFIVTNMEDLEEQVDLEEFLTQNFPLTAQTDDYLIFDLQRPLGSAEQRS
jgi:4-amino-4-deoxy-L-arabinose transferase-like glycosyltransferase